MEFIKPGTNIDFVGKRKTFALVSGALVGISLLLATMGNTLGLPFAPKYGVDFAGGTEIHLQVADGVGIEELRSGLASIGLSGDAVQSFGGSGSEYLVRVEKVNFGADEFFTKAKDALVAAFGADAWKGFDWDPEQSVRMTARGAREFTVAEVLTVLRPLDPGVEVTESKVEHQAVVVSFPGLADHVTKSLAAALPPRADGEPAFQVASVEVVGPAAGAEMRRKAVVSLVFALALILVYVAFRFDLAFAPGAVIALFHDVLITVGVFCFLGQEFTLQTVGALLTIVGYSINDTIVIYDRIRENMVRYPRRDLADLINLSMNETLGRTLITSGTVFLSVLALLIFGGPILSDFALAMLVGVVAGTYSTIYIASPMILLLQRWIPVELPGAAAGEQKPVPAAR
jgi:preprotein translocase subunit SecF